MAAAMSKMGRMMKDLTEDYHSTLKKKEDDIQALQDEVRSLKITDRLKVIET